MDTRCHSLKHEVGAASRILAEMHVERTFAWFSHFRRLTREYEL
ncbi:MAG: hypothetical protein ACK5ZE_10595 [Pseudanabaena sp.]